MVKERLRPLDGAGTVRGCGFVSSGSGRLENSKSGKASSCGLGGWDMFAEGERSE